MEKYDFSKMLIKDSEFYRHDSSYTSTLRKHNITTVEQLFDDELISKISQKCQRSTRQQLNTFISLLKYKFLNIPLCNDALLDKKIDIYASKDLKCDHLQLEDSKYPLHIGEFLGISYVYGSWLKNKFITKENILDVKLTDGKITVIEFLRYISNNLGNDKKIKPAIVAYIESYDNNSKINKVDINLDTITNLKNQLSELVKMRDNIDMQIVDLQQQINALSNNEVKDGIRK